MTFSGTPRVSALFLIWEQQIKVLCESYLMGLAPQPVFFGQLPAFVFTSFLFSSSPFLPVFSPPPPLLSACLCDMENEVRRNREGGKKIDVDPPASPVRLMLLFVVPQGSELSPLILFFALLSAPPSSAGTQNGLAVPGASGHKRCPRLLQSYQGTNG